MLNDIYKIKCLSCLFKILNGSNVLDFHNSLRASDNVLYTLRFENKLALFSC